MSEMDILFPIPDGRRNADDMGMPVPVRQYTCPAHINSVARQGAIVTPDDLRALLDAAGRPYPSSAHEPWPRWQDASHIAVRRDDIAALARIALAAVEHERVRSTVVAERARNAGEYDAAINAMLQSRADLVAAIADAGLLTTAPQEPQP